MAALWQAALAGSSVSAPGAVTLDRTPQHRLVEATVTDPRTEPASTGAAEAVSDEVVTAELVTDQAVEAQVLVEDVSIDGMCGVY
jgi:mycofactocin precursor